MSVANFTYDGYNRLATSTTAAETTTYSYNALGERMKKRNQNGLQTVFHYGPNGELLYEKDQAGNTKAYVWLDGRPLARIDNDATIYYYHVDHLGTPQAMTSAAGAIVWKGDYEPFGKVAVKVSAIENNLRFPGQYADRETGLYYNYFRDYDPGTGRYVESDPIGLDGGLNLYGYANQNPVMFTDPTGEAAFLALVPLFAGGGGATASGGAFGAFMANLGIGAGAVIMANAISNTDNPSDTPSDKGEKARERKEYSRICKTPIFPTGNPCADAKNNLKRLKQCLGLRKNFGRKWYNGGDAGHRGEIENTRTAINKLEGWIRKNCGEQCEQ